MQLDCTELGMLMTIMKTSKDTDGKSLEMEWTLTPNSGGTPVHIHPEAIETYEILAGELQVFKKDKWITARVGQKIVIEKGEPHTFKNATNEFVHEISARTNIKISKLGFILQYLILIMASLPGLL